MEREYIYISEQPESTEKDSNYFLFLLLHFIIVLVTQLHDPILRGIVDAILFVRYARRLSTALKSQFQRKLF